MEEPKRVYWSSVNGPKKEIIKKDAFFISDLALQSKNFIKESGGLGRKEGEWKRKKGGKVGSI